jgi:8-oxo-dGTP pyrophosphatase MutT (NUDIX family)
VTDEDLIPAATVLLLRDAAPGHGLEVLMLRRNSKIAFGGMWVFPGGAIDDHEHQPDDILGSARTAAVREVEEETGLTVTGAMLETWSFWVPPTRAQIAPSANFRRYATWFFVTEAPEGEIVVDGGEIHEHKWLTPTDAMAQRQEGTIELAPPTWVTLLQLSQHPSTETALAWASTNHYGEFRTRPIAKNPTTLTWIGDHAYEDEQPADEGRRHRLTMHPEGWVYERTH